jgi:hypothetical protein
MVEEGGFFGIVKVKNTPDVDFVVATGNAGLNATLNDGCGIVKHRHIIEAGRPIDIGKLVFRRACEI